MRQSKLIGDKRVDREIDALWEAIEALRKAPQNQTEPIPAQTIRETGKVRVENESRDFFGFCRGFVFNDANGIELEELGDEIHVSPLPTIVRKNSTGSDFIRRRLNLIEGSNVTLTVADDGANDEVDVTIAAASAGSPFDYAVNNGTTINLTASSAAIDVVYTSNASLVTVNLPTAVGIAEHCFVIKRGSAVNAVTVDPNSTETIDGAGTKTLGSQYAAIWIISDGANWQILSTVGTVT